MVRVASGRAPLQGAPLGCRILLDLVENLGRYRRSSIIGINFIRGPAECQLLDFTDTVNLISYSYYFT